MLTAGVPKVVYNNASQTLTFSLPQQVWRPSSLTVGGRDRSGAGLPESFSVRRDHLMRTGLRFYESEWPNVATWLEWAQDAGSAGSFDYWFNHLDAATALTCWLESPAQGEEIAPERDGQFLGAFTLPIVLRRVNGQRFDVRATSY